MQHLLSDKLVKLIESNADTIVKRWLDRLLSDLTTSTFSKHHLDYITNKANQLLKNLGQWISYDTTVEDIKKRYTEEGVDLFKMGIPLCEVLRSMFVLRRIMWLFVVNESLTDSALELQQLKELSDRVILFYDRAQYYFTKSYIDAMENKMQKLWKLSKDDTEHIFFKETFYNK
ncbi:MAG: hypothetical protein A2W19_04205 [Spirochaetes bacterium RBG_16_49_21]|nr:MAG: hypothetical protein A2W19_04205 [Spirochaetes bacterium RBG_16_49_21]